MLAPLLRHRILDKDEQYMDKFFHVVTVTAAKVSG